MAWDAAGPGDGDGAQCKCCQQNHRGHFVEVRRTTQVLRGGDELQDGPVNPGSPSEPKQRARGDHPSAMLGQEGGCCQDGRQGKARNRFKPQAKHGGEEDQQQGFAPQGLGPGHEAGIGVDRGNQADGKGSRGEGGSPRASKNSGDAWRREKVSKD